MAENDEVSKNKLNNLKRAWDDWQNIQDKNTFAKAKGEYEGFAEWLNNIDPKNPEQGTDNGLPIKGKLKVLTINQYTSLKDYSNNKDYFTDWIERKTVNCGRFFPGPRGIYVYGIHLKESIDSDSPVYVTSEQLKKGIDKNPISQDDANDFFNKKVREELIQIADLKALHNPLLGINYARKVAYMFNPSQLLPLYQNEVIRTIAKYLNIESKVDTKHFNATQYILEKLVKEWRLGKCEFEHTQKLGAFLWETFGDKFSLNHKNIIYYGAPGTGKTHTVQEIVKQQILIDGDDERDVCVFAQFHPSYSYEDFIEGFKPVVDKNGSIALTLQSGQFKQLCKKALDNLRLARNNPWTENINKGTKLKKYYFIADEINRAELSRVLGEVLVCLEETKRVDFDEEGKPTGMYVKTQYSHLYQKDNKDAVLTIDDQHYFGVPSNLYFIGTMNDIDRSIDSFDLALRRRFFWERMDCDYDVIEGKFSDDVKIENYINICKKNNSLIAVDWGLGRSYEIGHAYFMEIEKINNIEIKKLFETKIKPLLAEYLRAEYNSNDIGYKLEEAEKIFSPKENESKSETKNQATTPAVQPND